MKPKSTLRSYLVIAATSLLAIYSASALTYTWTQTATGSQDWTTGTNWNADSLLGATGQYVSGSGNELRFFADITTLIPTTTLQTVSNVPATLEMNTLTLNGKGPNVTTGFPITIGTSASTWTIGDDATSTVNLNSALGGGSGDRDIRYTIAANIELRGGIGGITLFQGGSGSSTGAVFSGNITQTALGKGITKSGASLLIFSGNNSYTGTTLVSGGVLRLNSATALSGGIGATGGTSALTINGTGVVELGAGNFQRNLGIGSDQFQITSTGSNAVGFSAIGGPRIITVNNAASQELQWGSTSFAPAKLLLNAASANDSLELTNKIDLNGATRTVVVNANKALLTGNIQQTTGGTAGLTKEGAGTLVLTGNNNYNGNTTITGGTLSVGAASNFGSGSSGLIMNAGTLQITGTALTSISGLGHAVTFGNNAKGFDINNVANTFTLDQVFTATTLTKSGAGALVLNQDNGFTGATTAPGGGTLVLDYTTNTGSKLADAASLTLSGGKIVLKNGSSLTETVGSTVLAANSGNTITRDGGDTKINLNAITQAASNTGNLLATLAIAEAGIVSTTTANDASGIQALGRITIGSNFATKDVSNLLQAYSIPVLDQYTAGGGGGSTAVVNQLTGGGTMTGVLTSHSLKIVNSGSSDVLDLGSLNLAVANGGTVLYAGAEGSNYTINGTATSGGLRAASGSQHLNVNVFAGTLTVNAFLTTGSSLSALGKSGAGTLVAGAANLYGGATYIQQGTLLVNNTTGSGTGTGPVIVQTGATLGGTGTIGGNTTINSWGKLSFNLSTAPGSHDKLDIDTAKTLTFSGDSVLTITSIGGATTGPYTLVTAAGGISGSAPTTVNLPGGWTADAPQIVGNDLRINITSTGGGGITFADWKTANGAGLQTLADDHDGDGVDNGTEFFLGGNTITTGFTALPPIVKTGGTLSVTWAKHPNYPGAYNTDFVVETSETLIGAWTTELTPPSTVTISGNNVTYTFPNPLGTKKFARLKVTGP